MTDDVKTRIAARAAQELHPGEIVNLGIGIPNLIPGLLGDDANVFLHTENGLLGVGPRPGEDELDPDLIDAAKRPVTALPGAAYFDSAQSFAMIRGGHVDVAVLGALQVSAAGDIANWAVPGKDVLGVGGAMDLVVGARRVIVTMTATSSAGEPKVVPECTYPLTARGAADVVVTELSVFRLRDGALVLTELLGDATADDVRAVTGAPFDIDLEDRRAA
jgi:3-oxoacid CoA-transferase B subunit